MLAMGVGAVCSMPVAGALIHGFGAVAMCVAFGLVQAGALALPPYAPTPIFLGAAAFMIGVGLGGVDIAMNAHAAAVERAWGRPIMSSIHAFSIGGLFGAAGSAGLIALGASAAAGMGAGALTLAGVVAAASLRLRFADEQELEAGPAFRLPSGAVMALGVLAVCSFLCEGAMMEWSAVFLRDVAGAPVAIAAGGYAAFSATMTVARLAGDRFVERLGPAHAVQASGALAAAALMLVAFAPNAWVAYVGILLAGLGLANVVPPLFSAAGRVAGVSPAAALAMVASMGYGGGLVGPPAIGFLSDAVGLRFGFAVLGVAALVIALGAPRAISPPSTPRRG